MTQILNAKGGMKMLLKSVNVINNGTSDENIININSHNRHIRASRLREERIIIFGWHVALLLQEISQFGKPLPRSLFKTIEGFL